MENENEKRRQGALHNYCDFCDGVAGIDLDILERGINVGDEPTNGRRELGELSVQVKSLADNYASFRLDTREDFKNVFAKLDGLAVTTTGVQRNTERIEKIEAWPHRWISIGIAGLAALVATLAFWRQ